MVNATNYFEDFILTTTFIDKPTFVALFVNGSPGDTGTQNAEVSGGGYARKSASWTVVTGTASLAAALVWTNMPAASVGGWGVYDAAEGGNLLIGAALNQVKTVAAGDSFSTDVGALTVTCD